MDVCVISGAGPVGCLLGLLLSDSQPNLSILVLEKRPDYRNKRVEDTEKRELKSINLALSNRGRNALRAVGLEDEVLKHAIPMWGRVVHPSDANPLLTTYQPYDDVDGKNCIYSVSRSAVADILLEKLEKKKNVKILFNKRIASLTKNQQLQKDNSTISIVTSDNVKIRANIVFGCDGAYSSVREAMSRLVRMDLNRKYITMGYMEFTMPPAINGKYALENFEALHIWPREDESHMMLIALPNTDFSFTVTLFAPFSTLIQISEEKDGTIEFMKKHFSSVFPLLDSSLIGKPHPLFTCNVSPWNVEGLVVLLGDAAHTQVPFFGQGMNAGLEDAFVFVEGLKVNKFDWKNTVIEFDAKRRPCGEAITQLSLENYEEMHTHSGSLLFRLRRRFEGFLTHFIKSQYVIPLYYQVAFTLRPYDEILKSKKQILHFERILSYSLSIGSCFGLVLYFLNKKFSLFKQTFQ